MDSLRVLVADDSAAVRESLTECLSAERDLQIVGHAADGHEALRLAERLRPDVLLLDNSMPGVSGLEVARTLRRSQPQIAIIMYTADATCRLSAIAAGASAVMTKDEPIAELVQNIRSLPKVRARKAFARDLE